MKQLTYLLFLFVLLGCKKEIPKEEKQLTVKVLSIPQGSEVGKTLQFKFTVTRKQMPMLLLENSIGPKLFQAKRSDEVITFDISDTHTQQSGSYTWSLVAQGKNITSGEFMVLPKKESCIIETYLGPRAIGAGGKDYSMLVTIPTDTYDNPMVDGTVVHIMKQMDGIVQTTKSILQDGFAWKLLYSGENAGRMLVSAAENETSSKELTSIISPSNAIDFKISYRRVHEYADGNQVISFVTSPITDTYGNGVSDGTLVNFTILNKKGIRLQTAGTTLAGVATGRMLHPEEADEWIVKAFITGVAESEPIAVEFNPTVNNFKVDFAQQNRTIIVGPVVGFMNQLVPDGLPILLMIYQTDGTLLETKRINSASGIGAFILEEAFFPSGDYILKVRVAGLKKEYERNLGADEKE